MVDALKYLEDGLPCEVVFYDGKAISVELPNSVVREVIYTEPAVKGDTSGKVMKPPAWPPASNCLCRPSSKSATRSKSILAPTNTAAVPNKARAHVGIVALPLALARLLAVGVHQRALGFNACILPIGRLLPARLHFSRRSGKLDQSHSGFFQHGVLLHPHCFRGVLLCIARPGSGAAVQVGGQGWTHPLFGSRNRKESGKAAVIPTPSSGGAPEPSIGRPRTPNSGAGRLNKSSAPLLTGKGECLCRGSTARSLLDQRRGPRGVLGQSRWRARHYTDEERAARKAGNPTSHPGQLLFLNMAQVGADCPTRP